MPSSIAIIEDDQAISQMYRFKFEAEGFTVQTAENGKLGLELTKSMKPDIILLDVAVPEGPQLVVELRRLCPGANIVALGLREKDEDVLSWAEAGIAGYVPNTSSMSEMLKLIDQIGRGEQTCRRQCVTSTASMRRPSIAVMAWSDTCSKAGSSRSMWIGMPTSWRCVATPN